MPNLSLLNLATITVLVASTSAQNTNSTSPSNGTCISPRYDVNAPVNASAAVPVNITSEPWYLTVSLNDTRTDTTARTRIDGWLSTPANSTSQACVWWLMDLLSAQSSGTPNGGCTGSLSQNCQDFMRRSIVLGGRDDCPSLPSREEFGKACGGSALAGGYEGTFPLHFLFPCHLCSSNQPMIITAHAILTSPQRYPQPVPSTHQTPPAPTPASPAPTNRPLYTPITDSSASSLAATRLAIVRIRANSLGMIGMLVSRWRGSLRLRKGVRRGRVWCVRARGRCRVGVGLLIRGLRAELGGWG
jgi:hypothetical protein